MKKIVTALIILAIICPISNAYCEDWSHLQNCKPGEPGYVDFGKTELEIGDEIWLFNWDNTPWYDKNGYILPHEFGEYGKSRITDKYVNRFTGEIEYKFGYSCYGNCPTSPEVIPQQNAVYFHF